MIDMLDSSTSVTDQMATYDEKLAAKNFLAEMQIFREKNMTPEFKAALTDLESGKYKPNLSRVLDL